ncbi:MFS transporter [Commensalibacter oyaizuii]|uniref:MFS transporter n=1 Tax=Commensalibacter oyaizuii TaxID=3043873 RepID=A0ABT6PZS4_9PROT|nr:MFS transporter [Commensalibacter sp. TBRC 16381]MDI2090357.1 MFS transporter [Commensalibacter sp. TBRC 16381]
MIHRYMNDQLATRIVFFITGLITATWAVIVPFAKVNTGIDDAVLGFLLLSLGIGAIIAMPLAGPLSSRYGCRRLIIASFIIMLISAPFLSFISHVILLAVVLLIFGVGVGMTDCAMNIQAILVEKKAGKALMSGFHGMYSVGGIVGAGLMTGMLALGINVIPSTFIILMLITFLFISSFSHLLPYANPVEGPAFAIPKGTVLILGIICFVVFLVEGTVLDWSAVYLVDAKKIDDALGGLGFTVFAVAMTIGRLTGDFIINRFGAFHVVILGTMMALVGFYFVITGHALSVLLIGYFLIGGGCANIVPVMFNQIGRQQSMPQMVAVPAVTTLGYIGVLAGPAIVGFIAHLSSLPSAFVMIATLLLVVLCLTFVLRKRINMS